MPAIQSYFVEPIWEQFSALLPEREVDHPLGCHRSRIPDRVVFEKLIEVLMFGCAYWRIADKSCSDTTLRRRRDEWIDLGVMDALRETVLDAYDRIVGLERGDVAVDGCITKAPCGGEKAGRSPVDRGKRGIKRSTAVDARGIPLGSGQPPRLATSDRDPRRRERGARGAARGSERPPRPRLRLGGNPRAAERARSAGRDLREGQVRPDERHEEVGRGADQLLAQRPQEADMVHGALGPGRRFLGGLLGRGDRRETTHPGSLEPLLLGDSTFSLTVTYCRKLLVGTRVAKCVGYKA